MMIYNSYNGGVEASIEQDINEFDRLLQDSSIKLDKEVDCCWGPGTHTSVKIYRTVLHWLAMFSRIDLLHARLEEKVERQHQHHEDKQQQQQKTGPTNRLAPTWPLVAQIYYLYCCVKVSINIYFQYVHDLNMYKYKTVKSIMSDYTDYTVDKLDFQLIEQKILWSKGYLDLIGAPYLNLSFFVEIVYLYIYLLSFMTYYLGPIYTRYLVPLHFRFARVVLDTQSAKLRCIESTRREIRRYLISSYEFNSAASRATRTSKPNKSGRPIFETNLAEVIVLMDNRNRGGGNIRGHHEQQTKGSATSGQGLDYSIQQLKSMTSRGDLFPMNWSGRLIEQMSAFYVAYIIACHIYGVFLMAAFFSCMPLTGNLEASQYTFSDYLMLFENLCTTVVLIIAISFYCSTVFSSCTDQILHTRMVQRLIDGCTLRNRLKFNELNGLQEEGAIASVHRLNCELKLRQMNSDLLLVFFQFRLLVDQLHREIKSYGMFAIMAVIVIFSLPIMIRLHEPYLNSTTKMLQFCFFQATLFFLDMVLVPVCLVHNRTTNLYKSLSSLLAHTIETNSLTLNYCTNAGGGPCADQQQTTGDSAATATATNTNTIQLYNQHLVWLLRKELRYPDLFLRQFATKMMGIKFTFQTLIKIHFWLGVLTLSFVNILTSASGGVTSLGNFFNDPFSLYQYQNIKIH